MKLRVLDPYQVTLGGVVHEPGSVFDVAAESAAFCAGWVRNGWVAEVNCDGDSASQTRKRTRPSSA